MAKTQTQKAVKPVAKRASAKPAKAAAADKGSKVESIQPPVFQEPIPPVVQEPTPPVNQDPSPSTVKEEILNVSNAISLLQQNGYLVIQEEELEPALDDIAVVVIPYKKASASGDELLYALRAWDANLPGCKVVIIGDPEPWFSNEVAHIPTSVLSNNPQIDVAYKLAEAVGSHLVPEKFIWSNDDIYPVTPLHLADLELLTTSGRLGETKRSINGVYLENLNRTLEALKSNNLSIWDYSTHTPFVFEKTKLAEILREYDALEEGYLISSLYYNTYFPGVLPLKISGGRDDQYVGYVYKENPDQTVLKEAMYNRKFINHNSKGYFSVIKYLKQIFIEKSRFEI